MTDDLPPPAQTNSERLTSLAEMVVRCVREAGTDGIRKTELITVAQEIGLLPDPVNMPEAKLIMSFAIKEARFGLAENGEVLICDRKGGSKFGYRYKLASQPEEALTARLNMLVDIAHRVDNVDALTQAEKVRFASQNEAQEDFFHESVRMTRKGVGYMASVRFAGQPDPTPRRRRSKKKGQEQESLL